MYMYTVCCLCLYFFITNVYFQDDDWGNLKLKDVSIECSVILNVFYIHACNTFHVKSLDHNFIHVLHMKILCCILIGHTY